MSENDEKSGTELQVLSPSEAELDQDLRDEAVAYINRMCVIKTMEMVREIGTYVLRTFFDDNPENFRSRANGHATFQEIADDERLAVSKSWLYKAVAVVEQLRLLPEDVANALPFSHHVLLLPVHDEKAKLKLAKEAAKKGLSKRDLEAAVRKVRDKETGGARTGRPPLPAFVKGFTRISKAVKLAGSQDITDDIFAVYRPEDARKLLVDVDEAMARLEEIKADVTRAISEFEAKTGSEG